VLLTDAQGNVVEGPGLQRVRRARGRAGDAREGVLEGITRRTVIEMAQALGCRWSARAARGELRSATSSSSAARVAACCP
jgi:branched-chain amino acid aminotransferase